MYPDACDRIEQILEDIEKKLDPAEQEQIRRHLINTCEWQDIDRPPVQVSIQKDFQNNGEYPVEDAIKNPAKMLVNELLNGQTSVTGWLQTKDDSPLQVRPDFGIGLVASVFGAEPRVVENNPPWIRPLFDDDIENRMENMLDSFEPGRSIEQSWIPRVKETLDFYHSILQKYPAVSASIAVIMPDLQGPFDTAAMLWGSSIFRAIYDNPRLIEKLLKAVSVVMLHVYELLRPLVGSELLSGGFSHQHGSIICGNLLLRCDSNLLMSAEMYKRHVLPHDIHVLKHVGSGSYHSCGRWEHNIPALVKAQEIGSLDFGAQSTMNNIDRIYSLARTHKKHLNQVDVTDKELIDGSVCARFPTGATLVCEVRDIKTAVSVMNTYKVKSGKGCTDA